ncbi:MAG TPA: Mur ligase domain-containing protein, partial [Pseudolysinimonas sp.]
MSARIPPVLRPEHPTPRSLAALVQEFGLEHHGSLDAVEVTGVTVRTTEVQPGDLFAAIPGKNAHGASFAADAAAAGAVAVVTDREGARLAEDSGLPVVIVDDPRAALGDIAAWVYQTAGSAAEGTRPPLLFGTTGTNGKTSTSYLLEAILRQL